MSLITQGPSLKVRAAILASRGTMIDMASARDTEAVAGPLQRQAKFNILVV
jgi:hypothetical protein